MKASISIVVALAIVLAVIGVLTGVSDAEPDEMSVGANLPGETLLPDCQPEQPASAPTALSQSKIGWGLGSARNQLGQPADAEAAQKKYGPLGGQFLYGSEKQIVLTFDLGYENGYTESILDVLKAHGVRGVFFITADYLSDAPGIVQRIIDEGHVLGNHSVTHPSMPSLSAERQAAEITGLHRRVKEQFGYEMKLFRFPMGEFSEQALAAAQQLGYQNWFWSFAYRDWLTDHQPDPAAALEKVVSAAHPGAIYLLHAVSSTNAAILGDVITRLEAEGYTFTAPGGKAAAAAEGILPNERT